LSDIEARGKMEYKLYFKSHERAKSFDKLSRFSFSDLIGALTTQAKLIEEKCLKRGSCKERDELEYCVKKILKKEQELEDTFDKLSIEVYKAMDTKRINRTGSAKAVTNKVFDFSVLKDENNANESKEKSARSLTEVRKQSNNRGVSSHTKISLPQNHTNKFLEGENINEVEDIINLKNYNFNNESSENIIKKLKLICKVKDTQIEKLKNDLRNMNSKQILEKLDEANKIIQQQENTIIELKEFVEGHKTSFHSTQPSKVNCNLYYESISG